MGIFSPSNKLLFEIMLYLIMIIITLSEEENIYNSPVFKRVLLDEENISIIKINLGPFFEYLHKWMPNTLTLK